MTGTLKCFKTEKGYGFIAGDDGIDYFIHASNLCEGEYSTGDRLQFELAEGRKGIEAVKVSLV